MILRAQRDGRLVKLKRLASRALIDNLHIHNIYLPLTVYIFIIESLAKLQAGKLDFPFVVQRVAPRERHARRLFVRTHNHVIKANWHNCNRVTTLCSPSTLNRRGNAKRIRDLRITLFPCLCKQQRRRKDPRAQLNCESYVNAKSKSRKRAAVRPNCIGMIVLAV